MPPDTLSFLIDECLHASLVKTANEFGYTAHHIEHLGLKGATDWQLWRRAFDDDLIFVTNNAVDFRKLSRKAELHPGLIIILPLMRPEIQRRLFEAGLEYLKGRTSLINRVIEIDRNKSSVDVREYEIP